MSVDLIAYILSGIMICVAAGLLFIRKHNEVIMPILDDSDKIIEIVERLLDIYYHDDTIHNKTDLYIDIARRAVDEVRSVFDDGVDLKKKAVEITYRLLKLLDESEIIGKQHKAINDAIDEALEQLEKQKAE